MAKAMNGGGRLPPFQKLPKKPKPRIPSEVRHIAWCLIICVPTCTVVCLIVDRLLGG